jgi:hypothetical protein
MINQAKFVAAVQFFVASGFLFGGLLNLKSALSFDGMKNNFLADNWGTPLIFFLAIIFGAGWWFEATFENIVLSKGRKIAIIAFLGIFLIFVLLEFSALTFASRGFLQSAMDASGKILMSGFFFRFSVASNEVITKLQTNS